MREILEKPPSAAPARDAIDQKIGDYYGSCMDEKAADAKGVGPAEAGTGAHRRGRKTRRR